MPFIDWLVDLWSATLGNTHIWALFFTLPFIVAGIAGTLLPILPGTLLIWVGFLLYALITGFSDLGLYFFVGQMVLVGVSYLVDFLATAYGVRRYGGSRAAAWGAVIGAMLVFVIGPLGILVGPLAGAVLGELLMGEQVRQAVHSGWGSFLGLIGGSLAKLVIAGLMIGWFVVRIVHGG